MKDRTLVDNICNAQEPTASFDAEWLKEAEDRLAAYRSGELEAVDAEQVFASFRKNRCK